MKPAEREPGEDDPDDPYPTPIGEEITGAIADLERIDSLVAVDAFLATTVERLGVNPAGALARRLHEAGESRKATIRAGRGGRTQKQVFPQEAGVGQ